MPLITRVDTNYTIVRDDDYIGVMGRGAPITLTLPSILELPQNHTITIKDEGGLAASLPITLTGALGSQEIENQTTYIINVNFGSVSLLFNGTQWVISASNIPQILSINQGGTGASTAPEAVENLGIDMKDPVTVSAKANVNLAALPNVVNGVTLDAGESVNLWLQTAAFENGVYTVIDPGSGSNGVWERRADFNSSSEFRAGVQFLSLEGDSMAGVTFVVDTTNPVIGTDPISISPMSGATAVYDPYGNKVFDYTYVTDAVNYLRAENTSIGDAPRLRAWSDTETHVSGTITNKGNGRWFGLQLMNINDTTDINTASDVSYSGPAVMGSLLRRDPNGANRNDTLPSASTILSFIPQHFSRISFKLTISNTADADETITLQGNTGLTLIGPCQIRQGETREFLFYVDDVAVFGGTDTITVYDLFAVGGGGSGPSIGNGLVESMGTISVDIGPEFQFVGNSIYAKAIAANRLQEYVVNQTGSTVVSGTAVALRTNTDGSLGIVRADSMTNVQATHVVGSLDIADGAPGYVTKAIIFGSLDTSAAAADGSPLYLDMNGGYVFDTPPSGANRLVQVIGYVGNKDPVSGIIYFMPQPVTRFGTAFLQDDAVTAGKISASFSLTYQEDIISSPNHRLYIGSGSGSDPVVGATLVQATTGATATVTFLNDNDSLDVTSITGTFNTSDVVTGTNPDTSTFTFTPTMTVVDCWPLTHSAAAFSSITANDGTVLFIGSGSMLLSASKVRYIPSIGITQGQIETLQSDGWTSLYVEYARSEVVIA